jgi:ribosomal-protein-alanine N-acetyltransferase
VSTSFRIWQGVQSDAPTLAALHAPAFSDAWPAPALASLLERREAFVLLGAREGVASAEGFILMRAVAGEAEVLTFCVADAARGCGLGRALLEHACAAAVARGAGEIFLEVSEANAAALGLYRSVGFQAVARRPAYYHQGPDAADAIVMRRLP